MKRFYHGTALIFASLLLFAFSNLNGQNLSVANTSNLVNFTAKKSPVQKAYWDTLYYEDFSDSTLSNWTVIDSSFNGHNWIWSTTAPGGQYSVGIQPLGSTTSSNGFISLPSDLYNTPIQINNVDTMKAYIISKAIPIKPSAGLGLRYQHYNRYCCQGSVRHDVEVSIDSLNWVTFNAINGRQSNTLSPNGEMIDIALPPSFNFVDTLYIRFVQSGSSHYFWMIDDLTIWDNNLNYNIELSSFAPLFNLSSAVNDSVGVGSEVRILPESYFDQLRVHAKIKIGGQFQTNLITRVKLIQDSLASGQVGAGQIFQWNDSIAITNNLFYDINFGQTAYSLPLARGKYHLELSITSDSTPPGFYDPYPLYGIYDFEISDTIFSNTLEPSTLVGLSHSLPGASSIGFDQLGILITNGNQVQAIKGLSFYLQDAYPIVNSLGAQVYSFDPQPSDTSIDQMISGPIATPAYYSSFSSPYIRGWNYLPFSAPFYLQPNEQYVISIAQQLPFSSAVALSLGSKLGDEHNYKESWMKSLYYLNGSGWYLRDELPAIKFHIDQTTGLSQLNSEYIHSRISPNPSNGLINIQGDFDFDQIEVLDLNGRLVHQEGWNQNDQKIDLSFLEEGLYFLRLRGEVDRVEKVVIQH